MNLLFLNWRDQKNPRSGGAEVVTEETIKRLVLRGHNVTLFSTMFPGAAKTEVINGYTVIRHGREYTVHFWALVYWFKTFKNQKFDVVIDQIHGIPFFTPLYVRGPKVVSFIHEVAREIWLKMYRFPIGWLGFHLEPLFFKAYKNSSFITVSNATKRDLMNVGIKPELINIIPEAVTTTPLSAIPTKETIPTILFVGRVARMKGVGDLIEANLIAKQSIPDLRLWIVGGGDTYKAELESQYKNESNITFFGHVSETEKNNLYARAHLLVSASIKEGFGLVVIEAAAHGTPSVVYNVDGFNEAVIHNKTGVLTDTNPHTLANGVVSLFNDKIKYTELQKNALEHSRSFNFENTTNSFEKYLNNITK